MDRDNETENKKLLYKYLVELYGEEPALKLMLRYKDNLWGERGLAVKVGKESMAFFFQYFMQDTFTPKPDNNVRKLAPVHYEIWSELQAMFINDEYDKLELIMPRGSAKTTVCDLAVTIWAHCYKLSTYSLVCGKVEQDATDFIKDIRMIFEENPYILKGFGKLIKLRVFTVNKLELELANKTKIQAISSTSSIRGKKYSGSRPSLIICDDFQGLGDIVTQESRDKKFKSFSEDSSYAGDKEVKRDGKKIKSATKFIVLGTVLHSDCLMSRLIKDQTYKTILHRCIQHNDVNELFSNGLWAEFKKLYFDSQSDGLAMASEFYIQHENEMQFETLWPDKYNCLDLAIEYYNNPTSFRQEMQNDPSNIGEKVFHQITSKSKEFIESQEFTKTLLCVDPAVNIEEKHDFSAFCVGSLTANNFRWIRKGIIEKVLFDDYIDQIISLLKDYQDITHVWIEKNTYNGTDAREVQKRIDEDPDFYNRKIKIINQHQTKNKEAKIRSISGKVDSGFFIFNEDDRLFQEQIIAYSSGYGHDDAPDIVAQFDIVVDEIKHDSVRIEVLDRKLLGF